MESMHPSDVLVGIGYFLPEGRKCFKRNSKPLNNFFYEQKKKHPELLARFHFQSNPYHLNCKELEQSIASSFGLVLVASSAAPGDYHFDSKVTKECYENHVSKRMSDKQKEVLEQIAREFDLELAVPQTLRF